MYRTHILDSMIFADVATELDNCSRGNAYNPPGILYLARALGDIKEIPYGLLYAIGRENVTPKEREGIKPQERIREIVGKLDNFPNLEAKEQKAFIQSICNISRHLRDWEEIIKK